MKYPFFIFAFILAGCAGALTEADFVAPPAEYRPAVWGHWLNGWVSPESIRTDLEAMKAVGLGGVCQFDVAKNLPEGPCDYLDEKWRESFTAEVREATRLNLEMLAHHGPGYQGNGGSWMPHELAAQKIVWSSLCVTGTGVRVELTLPTPEHLGTYYRDIALVAVKKGPMFLWKERERNILCLDWRNYIRYAGIDPMLKPRKSIKGSETVVLQRTAGEAEQTADKASSVSWLPPEGVWQVYRFGHAWSGQTTLPASRKGLGPDCDKLDKRGIRFHFERSAKQLKLLADQVPNNTFRGVFMDSWESGGQNWTERMPQEFKQRRGYDVLPYLPIMAGHVVKDTDTSERFLFDFRTTGSELIQENFWEEMYRLCKSNNILLHGQSYITPGNDFDAGEQVDEPWGEYWTATTNSSQAHLVDYRNTIKFAASLAHIMGRRRVGVEAFTSHNTDDRFHHHPGNLKPIADRIFCLGGNRLFFHRYAMQYFNAVRPGLMMGPWGVHYERTQTWWNYTQPWHDYLARCQYLLQQGERVVDVLRLYPEEPLARYYDRPIMGYDSDAIGGAAFKRLIVKDGHVGFPNGPFYKLLFLEPTRQMSFERLNKLEQMLKAGAVIIGEPPERVCGLKDAKRHAEFQSRVASLWSQGRGPGKILQGISPAEVLSLLKVQPDVEAQGEILWTHRNDGTNDIYFVASSTDTPQKAKISFRVTGKAMEVWHPEKGTVVPVCAVTNDSSNARMLLDIDLNAHESLFVIFKPSASSSDASIPEKYNPSLGAPQSQRVSGPWAVDFPGITQQAWGSLKSWSDPSLPDAIRYFSGTATYTTSFKWTGKAKQGVLDLGEVQIAARVWLNNKELGIAWRKPYRLETGDALKQGENVLKIEVVNLWINQLIGDERYPDDCARDPAGMATNLPPWLLKGGARDSKRTSFASWRLFLPTEPLVESGLLGPVALYTAD
jgi:hypothetical protein